MADLLKDDKLQNGDQGQQTTATGANDLSGASSNDVGSGQASTAGIGPGGQGAWTNIQAYLNANKSDTGSSNLLNNTVGGQFDSEKQKMTADADKYVTDAKKQVDDSKINNDQADNYIKQAGQNYNYSGPQNNDYQKTLNSMQSYLKGQYNGPSSYNYGMSADTQNYGTNLGNQGGFDQMMGNIYSKAAGTPLSGGQYNLQKQFDTGNENLANMRQNLLQKYAGLNTDKDNLVTQTDKQLGDLAQQDRNSRTSLADYLGGRANDLATSESQAEGDARNSFQNEMGGSSGRANAKWDYLNSPINSDLQSSEATLRNNAKDILSANNIWGNNLTYNQLAKEQELAPKLTQGSWQLYDPSNQSTNQNLTGNNNILNHFYADEDKKYTATGDDQKRQWNAIQDFLNTTAERKGQGFHVNPDNLGYGGITAKRGGINVGG